jgi:hypothetical protein
MPMIYYRIRCGDQLFYYPSSDMTKEEAMEDAKLKCGCEPVFEGMEYT